MKNGVQIPWNAVVICEMSKTSWQMGKHLMRRLGEPIKGPIFPFGSIV